MLKRVGNVYIFRLSVHFAYHRWWLGNDARLDTAILHQMFQLRERGSEGEWAVWQSDFFFLSPSPKKIGVDLANNEGCIKLNNPTIPLLHPTPKKASFKQKKKDDKFPILEEEERGMEKWHPSPQYTMIFQDYFFWRGGEGERRGKRCWWCS